jgi:hypothetical protein
MNALLCLRMMKMTMIKAKLYSGHDMIEIFDDRLLQVQTNVKNIVPEISLL